MEYEENPLDNLWQNYQDLDEFCLTLTRSNLTDIEHYYYSDSGIMLNTFEISLNHKTEFQEGLLKF